MARIASYVRHKQDNVPGRYIASPVPLGMLAAASTPYVRQGGDSYPAREVDNEKNEQEGPKNAATNIHFDSPLTYKCIKRRIGGRRLGGTAPSRRRKNGTITSCVIPRATLKPRTEAAVVNLLICLLGRGTRLDRRKTV
jgi:hypothetical protein